MYILHTPQLPASQGSATERRSPSSVLLLLREAAPEGAPPRPSSLPDPPRRSLEVSAGRPRSALPTRNPWLSSKKTRRRLQIPPPVSPPPLAPTRGCMLVPSESGAVEFFLLSVGNLAGPFGGSEQSWGALVLYSKRGSFGSRPRFGSLESSAAAVALRFFFPELQTLLAVWQFGICFKTESPWFLTSAAF